MAESITSIVCECGYRIPVSVRAGINRIECPVCGRRHRFVDERSPLGINPFSDQEPAEERSEKPPRWTPGPNVVHRKKKKLRRRSSQVRWIGTFVLLVLAFFSFIVFVNGTDFDKLGFSEIEFLMIGSVFVAAGYVLFRMTGY